MRYVVAAVLAVLAVVMLAGTLLQCRSGRATATDLGLAASGAVVALGTAAAIALDVTGG